MNTLRLITAQLLIVVIFGLGLTACPTKPFVEKAANQSLALAKDTRALVSAVDSAYTQGLLSVDQKNRLADKLVLLANGGAKFNLLVQDLRTVYGDNIPPKDKIDVLIAAFSGNVVDMFINVLSELKLVNATPAVTAAVESIKATVLLLATSLGRKTQVQARVAEVSI